MAEYTASRLSEGNKLFPPSVTTGSEGMKIKFPKMFGGKETFVSYNDISSISYDAPMIGFTQLHINIRGKVTTVEGFYKGDCQAIITTWNNAKNTTKTQELKHNRKLKDKKSSSEIENEKFENKSKTTKDIVQQQLSTLQQMELEVKKLELKKLELEAKEKEKERSEKRENEKIREREKAKEKREEIGEKVAGVANNVKEWLSKEEAEDRAEEDAKEAEKIKKIDEVRSIVLNPTDKDSLIKSLTSLTEYAGMWAEESNPDEDLMVAKSNFDTGIAMLQALVPDDPMVSYFIQKQTLLEKRSKKAKMEKLVFSIIGILVFIGISTYFYITEKK